MDISSWGGDFPPSDSSAWTVLLGGVVGVGGSDGEEEIWIASRFSAR